MMLASFTSSERRALRILLVVALVTRIALALRPEWRIVTRPYNEDSFYIFTVADHLAHGDGITVDGVHPTNGIQPLVAFIYVPFFLLAGVHKVLALRLCFIVIALCDTLSVLLIAKLLKQLARSDLHDDKVVWFHPPVAAAALWTLLYPVLVHTANGLETALYSMLIIASAYVYAKLRSSKSQPTIRQWLGFGALLGLTVLSRIDAVFLVIAFALVELIRFRAKGILSAAAFSLTAFVVSSPWWIYNYTVFGSIMPQSGMSESMEAVLRENLRRGAIVVGDILSVFFFLPNYDLPEWFHYAWMAALIAIVVLIAKRLGLLRYLRTAIDGTALAALAIWGAVLIVYYVFFFSAPHFLPRYFQPLRILWLVIFSAAVPVLVQNLRHWLVRQRKLASAAITLGIVAAIGFGLSRYIYYFTIGQPHEFYQASRWAMAHPNDLIGMEQSGTCGFFAPNVVNLDGKVNYDALKARKKGDIGAYISERKITYIADWDEIAIPMVQSAERHGAKFVRVDTVAAYRPKSNWIVIYKSIQ